jgi:hypothetical protein
MLFLLILLLGACTPADPTPIQLIPLDAGQAVGTATYTAIPTRTSTAAATATPKPTLTSTPYKNIDFSQVEIGFGGFLSEWRYFITLDFTEPVRGEYYALVDRNKPYQCEVRDSSPNRLYCSGPLTALSSWTSVELYALDDASISPAEAATQSAAAGGTAPVLTGRFFVPPLD